MTVAGHHFNLQDRCTLPRADGTVCPIRWLHIHDADRSCLHQSGWAHVSTLTERELAEIEAERDRRAALYDAAINQRAVPAEEEPEVGYLTMWVLDPNDTEEF